MGDQEAMPIYADHSRCPDHGFQVLVLVAMKHQLRFRTGDVVGESNKTVVDLVFTVVHVPGRIVGEKNVHWRKVCHLLLHLELLEQIIALWLVLPRTTKTAECDTAKRERCQVHIADGCAKRRTGIVIAFDRKNLTTTATACNLQDDIVGHIAKRHKKIGWTIGNLTSDRIVIRNDEEIHWSGMVKEICGRGEWK